MFVVLDTSIFCRDFLLRGKAFRIFLESLKCVPAKLCIPEVVLDEVIAKYQEALKERTEAAETARNRLNSLLLDSPLADEPSCDHVVAVRDYETYFKEKLKEAEAKILPYPDEPHKKIVQQALHRRKPFNRKGQGYRDYLIWVTLRTEMYYAPEETVVLVTGNTRDFCDGAHLAQSLAEEVARYHHPGAKVSIYSSLDEFNASHVIPRLELQSKLRDALARRDATSFDLHGWAVTNLRRLLRDEEYIVQATHGLEPEHVECHVTAIDTIDDLQVTEVRAISPTRRVVSGRAKVVAVLYLDASWAQYRDHRETRDLLGPSSEPFTSASWYETTKMTVFFSLLLDEGATEPIVAEVDAVEGPGGTIEINKLPKVGAT